MCKASSPNVDDMFKLFHVILTKVVRVVLVLGVAQTLREASELLQMKFCFLHSCLWLEQRRSDRALGCGGCGMFVGERNKGL